MSALSNVDTPPRTPALSFLVFSVHSIACVCACPGSSFWLYYISSDELILLFFPPKGYEFFFSCVIILLVNSWSKPGADTRKLGLHSAERARQGGLSQTG